MRILITGSRGFIGQNLVESLIGDVLKERKESSNPADQRIVGMDSNGAERSRNLALFHANVPFSDTVFVEFLEHDLTRNELDVNKAMEVLDRVKQADVVIHLAACADPMMDSVVVHTKDTVKHMAVYKIPSPKNYRFNQIYKIINISEIKCFFFISVDFQIFIIKSLI